MKLAMVVVVAVAGRASAEEAVPNPVPRATGAQLGMRIPWDVTIAPGATGVGLGGFGFDLGERLTDHLYLGAMIDYELVIEITKPDGGASGIAHRFRGGVEGRYYFHEGTATIGGDTDDCCCHVGDPITVARYDWVGLRLGEETVDEFTTHGQFADLSLGTDAQIAGTQVGVYLSAGTSLEAAAPSYYVTLGVHLAFGG